MTTVAIHSPQDQKTGSVVNLSKHGKVWRKQILPLTSINYDGRQIRFDTEYHKQLVRNFRSGAFPQVPFQLADASNTHTNDPERTRGELVDLRAEPTGLYGYFKLSDPSVVLSNRKLGVSCRIIENYARESDGRKFGHSLQHVLGTLDPRIVDMEPWESVELSSAQTDLTVDLSNHFYTKDGGAMADQTEDKHVVELSTAQLDKLNALLAEEDTDAGDVEDTSLDGLFDDLDPADFADQDEDPDRDEDEDADDTEDRESGGGTVGLAAMHNLEGRVLELTNQLAAQRTEAEVEQLLATGLAPSIIEAARPLLAIQSGVVELANGDQVSPSKAVRKLLRTVLDLANKGLDVVSFDQEVGSLGGGDAAESVRQAMVEEMDRKFGSGN